MKITHTIEGEGSDVILLHGFPSNMYFWDEIKEELIKNNKRVTVPEQRGYPLSEITNSLISDFNIESLAMDIEDLVKENNLNNELIIVGHDWGSIVGWALISRANIDVKKLISICGGDEFPNSYIYNNLKFKQGVHYISSFQDPEESSKVIDTNLESFFRLAYRDISSKLAQPDLSLSNLFTNGKTGKLVVDDKIINNYINHFDGHSLYQPICWYSNIDLNIEMSNEWRRKVDTPVTFLFGDLDVAVKLTDKMVNRLNSLGSDVTIKEIKRAGHWLPITHKESVINEIF
ncbi:MAG: alpha/beta hydrolase [Candidatus Actinomarinales bacterium]|nr:MAG: alpha/beta hydrolase [Candidatus Actinomarinales bacterium]